MCFESDSTMKKPGRNWGYKLFKVGKNGELLGEYTSKRKERKRNTWLNEGDFRPSTEEMAFLSASTRQGWRVFLFKKGAERWKESVHWKYLEIIKVKFRDVLSIGICKNGIEINERATVAKEIFIE